MSDITLEMIWPLVHKMDREEQLRLCERINAIAKQEAELAALAAASDAVDDNQTWGQSFVAMLDRSAADLGPEDQWPDEDAVEWVRKHRAKETHRRNPDWDDE